MQKYVDMQLEKTARLRLGSMLNMWSYVGPYGELAKTKSKNSKKAAPGVTETGGVTGNSRGSSISRNAKPARSSEKSSQCQTSSWTPKIHRPMKRLPRGWGCTSLNEKCDLHFHETSASLFFSS